MDYMETVLEFLGKNENLAVALEIAEVVEVLKSSLHEDFWIAFNAAMTTRLASSDYSDQWEVKTPALEDPFKAYAKSFLQPRSAFRGNPFLKICLEQGGGRSGYHLYLGLNWSKTIKALPDVDELRKLNTELNDEGFSSSEWWLGWRYLDRYLGKKEFYVSLNEDKELYINRVADLLWALFLKKRERVQSINAALK